MEKEYFSLIVHSSQLNLYFSSIVGPPASQAAVPTSYKSIHIYWRYSRLWRSFQVDSESISPKQSIMRWPRSYSTFLYSIAIVTYRIFLFYKKRYLHTKNELSLNMATIAIYYHCSLRIVYPSVRSRLLSIELPNKVNGILLDIGFNSRHIDEENRGFSYNDKDSPLDMRYEQVCLLILQSEWVTHH